MLPMMKGTLDSRPLEPYCYKPVLETTATGCRRTVDCLHQGALAKGEPLDQTTLFQWPQPLRLEGTTPSAQQFLLLEADITREETYCVSARSLWECREQHPRELAEAEPKTHSCCSVLTTTSP